MTPRRALFAGSFDPFTAGHEDIVRRALSLFDELVIGVGHNIQKQGLLTIENRLQLIRRLYAGEPRVQVVAYEGLTIDLCRRMEIPTLVRGLRSATDLENDRIVEGVNKQLAPKIETVYLLTSPTLGVVSSSIIKELVAHGADPAPFMPAGIRLADYL